MCTVCRQDKTALTSVRSEINPKMTLTVCDPCKSGHLEPRFLIIITGRQEGFNAVKKYISARRYVGDEILANEFA